MDDSVKTKIFRLRTHGMLVPISLLIAAPVPDAIFTRHHCGRIFM